jgi:hypothetical protein
LRWCGCLAFRAIQGGLISHLGIKRHGTGLWLTPKTRGAAQVVRRGRLPAAVLRCKAPRCAVPFGLAQHVLPPATIAATLQAAGWDFVCHEHCNAPWWVMVSPCEDSDESDLLAPHVEAARSQPPQDDVIAVGPGQRRTPRGPSAGLPGRSGFRAPRSARGCFSGRALAARGPTQGGGGGFGGPVRRAGRSGRAPPPCSRS